MDGCYMSELNGKAVCGGCYKVVDRYELSEDGICTACQYEQDAKLDNLTDEE